MTKRNSSASNGGHRFEVAISFAGDGKRDRVRRIAELLRADLGHERVFFDEWFVAELAGPDGQIVLQEIYGTQAFLVVVCVCERYSQKAWTQDEWRAILAFERGLRDASRGNRDRLRFLPLRFGDGEVDGLFPTAIVPDARELTDEQVVSLILDRLQRARGPIAPRAPAARHGPVTVSRLTEPESADVHSALALLDQRVPEHELFEPETIVRWLRESPGRKTAHHYFLVAKSRKAGVERVRGFTLMHSFVDDDLVFIAYLVADRHESLERGTITRELFRDVAQRMGGDQVLKRKARFLLEVDDPRDAPDAGAQRLSLARIALFTTVAQSLGYSLRALEIDYRQPHLYLPETGDGGESRMLLMYGCKATQARGIMTRKKVGELLAFVYEKLYPTGFSEVASESARYARYTRRLCQQVFAALPARVRLLDAGSIRRIVRAKGGSEGEVCAGD